MSEVDASGREEDQRLVDGIASGPPDSVRALEVIYARHQAWCRAVAHRACGDRQAAEDAVQDAMLALVRQAAGLRLTGRLTTWLYPVLQRSAWRINKRLKRETVCADFPTAPSILLEPEPGSDEALAWVLAQLPESQAEVLRMRVIDQLSVQEVAQRLGVPDGTVKSRLHHALATLRDNPLTRELLQS